MGESTALWRLSGELVTDSTNALKAGYDHLAKEWPRELETCLGLSREKLPPVLPLHQGGIETPAKQVPPEKGLRLRIGEGETLPLAIEGVAPDPGGKEGLGLPVQALVPG
mgnify:CR=1 FL=1